MSHLVVSNVVNINTHGLELNGKRVLSFESADVRDKKLETAYRTLEVNYPKFFKMDALSKLGWLCAEYLMKEALSIKAIPQEEVAMVLSNQKGSLDTDINYHTSLPLDTEEFLPSPAVFVYTLPNIVAGEICIRHGFKGENNFFISESFDADTLLHYTNALFSEGLCQAAIVGWIEVYQETFRALLLTVESSQDKNRLSFTTDHLNQLY
jgi:hypothetical protein